MSWEERRKHKRVSTMTPVLVFGDLYRQNGHTVDLSIGGCALAVAQVPKKGEYVHLLLQVPKPHTPINIQLAVVTWSTLGLCGLEFIRLSATDQNHLQHYLYMIDLSPALGPRDKSKGSVTEVPLR